MISIITPTYNPGGSIVDTYESIAAQEDAAYEFLVIDGGSKDSSVHQFVKWRESNSKFRFISERDHGLYDAMNKGVRFASGDYVLFLGAGDRLKEKNILSRIERGIVSSHPDILYGYVVFCYPNGKKEEYKKRINWLYPIRSFPISHQAVIAKRKLLLDYPFDLSFKIAADQDWIMKMYKMGKRFHYMDVPITDYDMTGISASEEGRHLGFVERCDIHKKYYPAFFKFYHALRTIKGTAGR